MTVAARSSDGRSLGYRFMDIHVPIEVLATHNPNAAGDPEWAGATGYYYGGSPYQGDDSGDSQVIYVMGRRHHAIQVVKAQTASFSLTVEASLNGQEWSPVQSAWTSEGIYNFDGLFKFLRFNLSSLALTGGYDNTAPYGIQINYVAVAD